MTQPGPDWDKIEKCQLWPLLGVTECDGCEHLTQCWGTDVELPEPSGEGMKQLEELLKGGT